MMDKLLTFRSDPNKGFFNFVIGNKRNTYLEKTASEYHPTIAAYINSAKPIPGKTQVLLTALGAGEFFGPNVNGDYFPESALAYEGPEYGHKTFVTHATVYKHHINKDPSAGYGKVLLSVYNPVYHRVELIIAIDNDRGMDIIEKIERGEEVSWSMGCKIPFDECSICGNKAPTRAYYCDHAKYMLNQIDPVTGKLVFLYNYHPRFHDISYVIIPADRIAKTLLKVASISNLVIGSAELAEKNAAKYKRAMMEKQIPVTNHAPSSHQDLDDIIKTITETKASEPSLPNHILDQLASRPLPSSMSTMASLGILPKPQEFQRIFLINIGQRGLADELQSKNVCFHPEMCVEPSYKHENVLGLNSNKFDPSIFDLLKSFLPDRSYAAPLLVKRIVIMRKQASVTQELPYFVKTAEDIKNFDIKDERKPVGIIPMLMAAAGLYAAFAKKAPGEASSGFGKLLANHPGLLAALGAGLTYTFGAVANPNNRGHASSGSYINPDMASGAGYVKRHTEQSKIAGEGLSRLKGGAGRIFLGIPAAYMASGMLQKYKEINPSSQEGTVGSIMRKYPDVISAGLAADALLATRGKGSYAVTKAITPYFKSAIEGIKKVPGLTKKAEWEDTAGEIAKTIAFPLSMGKANLTTRIIGSGFDMAALKGIESYVKRKSSKSNQ